MPCVNSTIYSTISQLLIKGGFTPFPCALGTIISGLAAGILFLLLLLLIATPFNDALKLVNAIAMPMVLGDIIGIAIFAFMLHNMKKERKTG
jgi:LytS/YehU family sensor histidine kinase